MSLTEERRNDALDAMINELDLPPEANYQLADPDLVSYYRDFKNRCLWIDKEISDSLFDEIRSIIQWNREDEIAKIKPDKRKPIILMIHSYGGSIDSCLALVDIIELSKTPIYTVNLNCALSAGCIIFINGQYITDWLNLRVCLEENAKQANIEQNRSLKAGQIMGELSVSQGN